MKTEVYLAKQHGQVFAMLRRAAALGAPCPTNREIVDALELSSISRPVEIMNHLVSRGLIRLRRYQNGRQVEIVETGENTAAPSCTSVHWRHRGKVVPPPVVVKPARAEPPPTPTPTPTPTPEPKRIDRPLAVIETFILPPSEEFGARMEALDRSAVGCRWPMWGDKEAINFKFCCASKAGPMPYCVEHTKKAYAPAQPLRPRAVRA